MNPDLSSNRCEQAENLSAYAMQALGPTEAAMIEAHVAYCATCRAELAALRPVVRSFIAWPVDVLRPAESLQPRLAARIAAETESEPVVPPQSDWVEPPWETVAPGISVKILAKDEARDLVSMLVRLEPGTDYPPHTHAGIEELHLLDGELWIDERKLHPGDYSLAHPGTSDQRVWSETGCTCVLITSIQDSLS